MIGFERSEQYSLMRTVVSRLNISYLQLLIHCISTVNTQHTQRPDVLVQLGHMWRHISAVKRPSPGQQRIVLLRYNQIVCPMGSHCLH